MGLFIVLGVVGFICLIVAAIIQDTNRYYANILGLSSFGFEGLALFLLIKNFANIVSFEIGERAEKMQNEADFFSKIAVDENPRTLNERFIKSGFKLHYGYLYKRQFTFVKDFIYYYVSIVEEEDIIKYLDVFLQEIERFFQDKSRSRKNNVAYVFFFTRSITHEELDYLKNMIINQDAMQEMPFGFDTVLPIVYDIANQEYIVRTMRSRLSIKSLQIALRKIYKMIGHTK